MGGAVGVAHGKYGLPDPLEIFDYRKVQALTKSPTVSTNDNTGYILCYT